MPYIDHPLGRTYYQRRGRKTAGGLPLVCVHGGPGGDSKHMAPLFDLSDERQVYLYDQIGGGRSSPTEKRRWNVRTFVRELATLVDAWGLEEFHLFGASWGTTLALEYTLKHPRRVRSLVFQSPMFSTADWEADANRLIAQLPADDQKVLRYCHEIGATDAEVYKSVMLTYYLRHVCRRKAKLLEMYRDATPNGQKIYAHMWGPSEFKSTGTLKAHDKVSRLADVTQPALVICGEFDEAQPRTGERYASLLPAGDFVCISNASHVILAEQPTKLVRAVRSFLRDS
jgi:proline-specific peptidase